MAKRRYAKRPKKKKLPVEIITTCDQCKKPLGCSHVRTIGSGICAAGDGLHVLFPGHYTQMQQVDKVMFFCSKECRANFGSVQCAGA